MATPHRRPTGAAMANTGEPDSNSGQFFFLWAQPELSPAYGLFGHVLTGLDILRAVGAGGDDGAYSDAGGGHPKLPLTFTKVTVSAVTTKH